MKMYRAWFSEEQDSAIDFAAENNEKAEGEAWYRLECDAMHYTSDIVICDEEGNRWFYCKYNNWSK